MEIFLTRPDHLVVEAAFGIIGMMSDTGNLFMEPWLVGDDADLRLRQMCD